MNEWGLGSVNFHKKNQREVTTVWSIRYYKAYEFKTKGYTGTRTDKTEYIV